MAKLIFREPNEPSKKVAVQKYERKARVKKLGLYGIILIQTLIIIYLASK